MMRLNRIRKDMTGQRHDETEQDTEGHRTKQDTARQVEHNRTNRVEAKPDKAGHNRTHEDMAEHNKTGQKHIFTSTTEHFVT
jgi:hypothetical protein